MAKQKKKASKGGKRSKGSDKRAPADERRYLGIDIGGTKLYAVVTDASGKILATARKKTRPEGGFEGVLERVVEVAQEACATSSTKLSALTSVGVGAPSPIRPDGTAVNAPNLGWRDVPLVPMLAQAFGCPVIAGNDCDVGTYGELIYGAGQGANTLVGLFMGTGLGGGIVVDGRPLCGVNNLAAEVGHMVVVVDGRRCGCGHHGCLEAYASKTGMGRRLACAIHCDGRTSMLTDLCEGDYANIRSGLLARAYAAGDELTVETIHEAARYLGVGVANLITLLGPDKVVLGGGVFEALGDALIDRVRASAEATAFPPGTCADTQIELAALGDDAVALGAVAWARRALD